MPPGNGMITSGICCIAATARSAAASTPAYARPSMRKLPPPTARWHAGKILADEFAVHHGNAPVALLADALRRLAAVAEIAQRPAERHLRVAGRARHSTPCRCRSARTGRRARAPPWRARRATRRRAARRCRAGRPACPPAPARARCPPRAPQPITEVAKPVMLTAATRAHSGGLGGDDEARRAHAEGLGEGIVDGDAVEVHARVRGRQACASTRMPASASSPCDSGKCAKPTVM